MTSEPNEFPVSDANNQFVFRLMALLGFVFSVVGIGGSIVLSMTAMPYYVAYYTGKALLLGSWIGLLLSVFGIGLGNHRDLRFKDAPRDYSFAWVGFLLPMVAFAYKYVFGGQFFVDW